MSKTPEDRKAGTKNPVDAVLDSLSDAAELLVERKKNREQQDDNPLSQCKTYTFDVAVGAISCTIMRHTLNVLEQSIIPPGLIEKSIERVTSTVSELLTQLRETESEFVDMVREEFDHCLASLRAQQEAYKKAAGDQSELRGIRCPVCGCPSLPIPGSDKTFHGQTNHCSNCGRVVKGEELKKALEWEDEQEEACSICDQPLVRSGEDDGYEIKGWHCPVCDS